MEKKRVPVIDRNLGTVTFKGQGNQEDPTKIEKGMANGVGENEECVKFQKLRKASVVLVPSFYLFQSSSFILEVLIKCLVILSGPLTLKSQVLKVDLNSVSICGVYHLVFFIIEATTLGHFFEAVQFLQRKIPHLHAQGGNTPATKRDCGAWWVGVRVDRKVCFLFVQYVDFW